MKDSPNYPFSKIPTFSDEEFLIKDLLEIEVDELIDMLNHSRSNNPEYKHWGSMFTDIGTYNDPNLGYEWHEVNCEGDQEGPLFHLTKKKFNTIVKKVIKLKKEKIESDLLKIKALINEI